MKESVHGIWNRTMKAAGCTILSAVAVVSAALQVSSCTKAEVPDEPERNYDDCIAFYVKARPTKAIIEDTDKLYDLRPSIYVTEDLRKTDFNNTEVKFTDNGVWRSNTDWADESQNMEYSFYAYTYSTGTVGQISGISSPDDDDPVANNGKTVTITQPDSYSANNNAWADFLMSYIVSANSATRGLVNLEFERITTGVELYMSKSPAMGNVTLTDATFSGIVRSATFNLENPAVSTDPAGANGMKNGWLISRDASKTAIYTYPSSGQTIKLKEFDPSDTQDGRFTYDTQYRVMNFLTVQQPMHEELAGSTRTVQLEISYIVDENGKDVPYTATFDLSEFSPAVWTRGHKVRYYLSIDTSTELTGTIAKWEEVDFIESTLLPDTGPDEESSAAVITGETERSAHIINSL